MTRIRNTLGPVIGYHGCDRAVAEKVLQNKTHLKQSDNSYDWLGPGIYFWVIARNGDTIGRQGRANSLARR